LLFVRGGPWIVQMTLDLVSLSVRGLPVEALLEFVAQKVPHLQALL
jgi:hypothetical protein